MAENRSNVAEDGDKTGENSNNETRNSLEDFVTGHYQRQKEEGRMDSSEELSEERTQDFFARALTESRRMNAEVSKSNKKLDALHAEFGMDMINSWQEEHASEVLQPHEQQLVKLAQYQNPDAAR
ncbi:uncharacterized protein LOC123537794 [Mercenaria mercenaria]|uniref:uncharacterized protein LOC123537794 n=1 Tax=Mercenaria mercenaria TaxID=6596 RepID=UPI00234E43E5|nr:uncharacterized protein LOC123537794 [Mercenaria mercenaria]